MTKSRDDLSAVALAKADQGGYVLLELLISLLISGFITTGLFTSFFQLHTAMSTADYITSVHQRATLVYQQFDRDLAGAFKPTQAKKDTEKTEKKDAQQDQTKQARKTDEQKKEKLLTHIFYGTVKNKQFELLTCITDNPLQVYWSDRAGSAKPRIARVVYRLMKEKGEPVSYRLVRQEGFSPLEWDAFIPEAAKKIREIELVTGIKECTVVYTVAVEKKSEKSEGGAETEAKKKKKKAYEYKESKEWRISDKEKEKATAAEGDTAKQKKEEPQKELPDFVTMKLVLWDDAKVREVPFEFTWAVGRALVGDLEVEKEEEEKPEKKPGDMPQTKEEAKKRFSETMQKLNALRDRTEQLQQQLARRGMSGAPCFAGNGEPGVRRFAQNGMPGAPTPMHRQQTFLGAGVSAQNQHGQRVGQPVSLAGNSGRPASAPGVVRVGDGAPAGGQPDAYAHAWEDMPLEIQEQLYAYYDDMPVSALDMRGM